MVSRGRKRPETLTPQGLTAIYARISEDPTGQQAGVGRQLADGRKLCASRGWADVAEFRDDDISASKYTRKIRPAYRDMLTRVRAGEITRIVCWHIDRLYRQPKELEELIDLADSGVVEIISVTAGDIDLSTSDGIAMARVMVAFAAKASDDMSRRILRQKAQQREEGKPTGARRCFGWIDTMTPHPDEAALVADAMDAVLEGASVTSIARSWNARGVRTAGIAKQWNHTTVRDLLINPRHAGLIAHYGEVIGDAAWPAIVDRETSERVRAVISARGAAVSAGRTGTRRSLLTGLVYCGDCGQGMWRANTNGRSAYRCPVGEGVRGCGLSIVAGPLEAKVRDAVFAIVDNLRLAQLVSDGADDGSGQRAAVLRLAAIDGRLEELADLYAAEEIDGRQLSTASRALRAEADALRSRLSRVVTRNALIDYIDKPGMLAAAWPDLNVERQRACVADAVERITISRGRPGNRFDPSRVTIGERYETLKAS